MKRQNKKYENNKDLYVLAFVDESKPNLEFQTGLVLENALFELGLGEHYSKEHFDIILTPFFINGAEGKNVKEFYAKIKSAEHRDKITYTNLEDGLKINYFVFNTYYLNKLKEKESEKGDPRK